MKPQAETTRYIKKLDLAPITHVHRTRPFGKPVAGQATPGGLKLEVTDKKPVGFVDKGSIVAFAPGVPARMQADVLHGFLLAQLNADQMADRETETKNWYENYRDVLENVGWKLREFRFQAFEPSVDPVDLRELLLDAIGSITGGTELDAIEKTIRRLAKLPATDARTMLFDFSSHGSNRGNMQVISCAPKGNTVVAHIAAICVRVPEFGDNALALEFRRDEIEVQVSTQEMTLDPKVYEPIRELIDERVEREFAALVGKVEL